MQHTQTITSTEYPIMASNVKHTVAEKLHHKSETTGETSRDLAIDIIGNACQSRVKCRTSWTSYCALKVSAPSTPSGLVHNPLPLEQALHLGHVLLHVSLGQLLSVGVQGLQILLPERRLRLLLLGHTALS